MTDVVVPDPTRNRRNDPVNRAAFEAQGSYFRRYDDAGFRRGPSDLLRGHRLIEDAGQDVVAVFHTHTGAGRRTSRTSTSGCTTPHTPGTSSSPFHNGPTPELQPFRVVKEGIGLVFSAGDNREGSELIYPGPEVTPMDLVVYGTAADVAVCAEAVRVNGAQP